jgi:hypothetical protein
MSVLGAGTFMWRVEAVLLDDAGAITQRGDTAERSFIIDIPLPGAPRLRDTGTLYGN